MKFNRDEELAINLLAIIYGSSTHQRAKDLAKELDTTEIYLQGIILKLKKAKLVETQSGTSGGVVRASREISVTDVMKALKRVPKPLSGRSGSVLTNVLNLLAKEKL